MKSKRPKRERILKENSIPKENPFDRLCTEIEDLFMTYFDLRPQELIHVNHTHTTLFK